MKKNFLITEDLVIIAEANAIVNLEQNSQEFKEYFESEYKFNDHEMKIIQNNVKKATQITIISHLMVEDKFRGKGFGKKILNKILDEVNNDCFLLIANIEESSFLEDFYRSFGFETIFYYYELPVMIKQK